MPRNVAAAVLCFGLLAGMAGIANAQKTSAASVRGFGLFEESIQFDINRVSCGLRNTGWICENSGHGTFAAWPKGTPNGYLFNSGPQVAGIIGPDGGPWAGDTTGGMFFDARGFLSSVPLTGIFSSQDPQDILDWPAAALVPAGGPFAPSLAGQVSASEGDYWWMAWEGEGLFSPYHPATRPHPLGVAAEFRVMGWNYPLGNEDIVYALVTYYNITSLDPAAYAGVRMAMRDTLLELATRFHSLAAESLGVTLPAAGYTVEDFHAVWVADPDVADAGTNYASVNLPLSMGYAWQYDFRRYAGWEFDPLINSDPFLPATGLVGLRTLGHSTRAFTVTLNGSGLADANSVVQLFRRAAGLPEPGCSLNPAATGICFIASGQPLDIRTFQSIGPFSLAPGESVVQAVAIVHAAPLPGGGCPGASCSVNPGNPSIIAGMDDPGIVAAGVNPIDSIAGFAGAQDFSGDGVLQGDEFLAVQRSLYWKAQVAEALFDRKFVLPQAPLAPNFFLIPDANSVTVVWQPSLSEETGDPYFEIAHPAQTVNQDGAFVPNVLYDPNYRQFDVEGYRIYRGRTDDPSAMTLIGEFDYTGTVISDYGGLVDPTQLCAPEISVSADCPVPFDPSQPGIAKVTHLDHPLVGRIIQTRPGDRISLMNGLIQLLRVDTIELNNSGVPFVLRDTTVRRGLRYFYAVTAFDVNSMQSGPASLESPRLLKVVRPEGKASNLLSEGEVLSSRLVGRGVVLDSVGNPWGTQPVSLPSIDAVTGRFSGPFPPANAWSAGFDGFVTALLNSGNATFTLDSVALGSPYADIPHTYWWTSRSEGREVVISLPIYQSEEIGLNYGSQAVLAVPVDPGLAARYGGLAGYSLQVSITQTLTGADYAGLFGRGCVNSRPGFESGGCAYNGSRWFLGPSPSHNETKPHPIEGNQPNFSGTPVTNYNNAGELPGVVIIHNTQAYQSVGGMEYRPVAGIMAGVHRAADYNVYWGTGGYVDSVIDVTHNVMVPFSPDLGSTWGVLNSIAARPPAGSFDDRAQLTSTDMGCVEPLRSLGTSISCGPAGPRYLLSRTAEPGPIAFFSPTLLDARTAPLAANAGIVFYLVGDFFTMELAGGQVPPAGTVWSLRQYVGAITGGKGDGGDFGPYQYSHPEQILPLTAIGTEIVISWSALNAVRAPTREDLSRAHPVPDPYMFGNSFTNSQDQPVIRFVNLPEDAVVRIYSSSGILVRLIEHHSGTFGGSEDWDVRTRDGRRVASGVYFYHIEAGDARRVGRMTIVNPGGGR